MSTDAAPSPSGWSEEFSRGMEHWHPSPGFYFQPTVLTDARRTSCC